MMIRPRDRQKLEHVRREIEGNPDLPEDKKDEAREILGEIANEVGDLEGERAFEVFVSGYVDDRAAGKHDTNVLCRCNRATCSVKNGQIPAKLKTRGTGKFSSQDPRGSLSEFLQDHPEAVVLSDAKRAFGGKLSRIRDLIDDAHAIVKSAETVDAKPNTGKTTSVRGD